MNAMVEAGQRQAQQLVSSKAVCKPRLETRPLEHTCQTLGWEQGGAETKCMSWRGQDSPSGRPPSSGLQPALSSPQRTEHQ
jgi:hypothetical protein